MIDDRLRKELSELDPELVILMEKLHESENPLPESKIPVEPISSDSPIAVPIDQLPPDWRERLAKAFDSK